MEISHPFPAQAEATFAAWDRRFAAYKFRSRRVVEWCASDAGPLRLLEAHTFSRLARTLRAREAHVALWRPKLPACAARTLADLLCGDAPTIETLALAEHFLLASLLHRLLAGALALPGARVTSFCRRFQAFAADYARKRPRVDAHRLLAKNRTTLSKRACARVLRCGHHHAY